MPKSPKGKKRKARLKKEKTKKHPKRLRFDEDEDKASEKSAPCSTDSEDEDDDEDEMNSLEEMLEKNAEKNNLTAINVKSILHHVVKDKRVRDLVQKVIAEEAAKEKKKNSEEPNPLDDIELDFEPKMTRSKFKQKHQDDPIARLTKSPIKIPKPVSTFTDLEFPESSSDEEYDPEADEEDEDTESCLSHQSDLASPLKPATPDSQKSDTPLESDSSMGTTSGSRPLTRHRSQEAIFKKPEALSSMMTPEKDDLIAKRTRSHLPLKDTPEFGTADVMLPDYMPDLYDTIKLDDLDKEDIDFQLFLQGLINGEDEDNATEDDDKEYDFMAENHKEEKEEYRNDRAVRIPKQEVSDLFEELLNEYDENGSLVDESALWSTRALLLDGEEASDKDIVLFTEQQRTQLATQMSQHLQLLCQIFLLSREDPTLQDEAETCRQYLNELQGFSERASSANYMMALKSGVPFTSMFEVPNLSEAVRIVNEPFSAVKRPRSPRKHAAVPPTGRKNKPRGPILPMVSSTNQAIMANSSLFQREELLPRYGFTSKDPNWTKDSTCLRIKFTETEDNLLALGMKQFQRNWRLIQSHLLPIKTPKQLQIRCKNLLSNRAQMNVVKHLRQTNTVWALSTKVRTNCSPDVHRRISASDAPDWLISYRQKLKNSRKQLTPKTMQVVYSSQSETLKTAVPSINTNTTTDTQSASTSGGKTIEGNVSEGALATQTVTNTCSMSNQKVEEVVHSKPIANEKESLNDVKNPEDNPGLNGGAIPRDSCENLSITESENIVGENASARTLCSNPNQDKKDKNDDKIRNETLSSLQNEPKSIDVESETSNSDISRDKELTNKKLCTPEEGRPQTNPEKSKTENQQPSEEEQQVEDDDGVLQTEHLESVVNDENMDCTSALTTDDQDKKQALASNSAESCSQGPTGISDDKAAKSPPVATTTKTKGSRDKSTVTSMSNQGPSTSKKNLAGPIPLDPDPKEQMRAQALADSYMAKVKKTLKNDQERYEDFLSTLVTSSTNQWTPVQLYNRIEIVLAEYPELVEDFIAFLEPEEALEAGVLMENLEFVRARTFLRRLEVHFHKSPSHFKKIIKAFSSWNAGDKTPSELHEKIIPLLRGQQHLIDEFQSFFDNLKPSICSEEDFEEVEIGSGSDPEVDDFEEVVIPDVIEPKKPKGKAQAKMRHTGGTTRTACTSNRQKITAQKPTTTTRPKQDQAKPTRRRNRPVDGAKKSPASRDDVSAPSEGEEETSGKKLQGGGPVDRNCKKLSPQLQYADKSLECDESPPDQNPSSVRTEGSASDGPLSVASSLYNETSNDSFKYDERDDCSQANKARIYQRTVSTDDVIDEVSNDVIESENDENVKHDEYSYDVRRRPETSDNVTSDLIDDVSTDVTENENDDNEDSEDEMTYEGTDETGEDRIGYRQGIISAKNHQLGQDGELVVLWTRDDDRTILSICHNQGATSQTFEDLSSRLTGKSAAEIKFRFEELMKLYQADSKEPSSSEEDDEDEDSDASEPETDL